MANIDDFEAEDVMSEKLPHANPDDTVSDVIGLMRKHDMDEIPVVEDGDVVGLINDDMFIDKRHLPFSTKLEHVMSRPPQVNVGDSLVRISEMLLSSDYRGVPVMSERGEYVGFIRRKDIADIVPEIDELKNTKVNDFMTPSPSTITEHEHIGKAKAMMKRLDVRVLPVVDKYGKLSGMVGIRDIVKEASRPITREEKGDRTGERDSPYEDLEVRSVMSEPPITTTTDSNIHSAAAKMAEHDVSTLVALEEDDIKGILTRFDLIEMLTSFREEERVYVQITGLEERPEVYDQMYDLIQNYLQKINKVLKPLVLNVHVVTHQKEGEQAKHSVRLRLSTDYGMFYAKKYDWNIMRALDESLDSIQRRVFEDKKKRVDRKKHPKYQKLI
ncbi:MAG: CBS domain-containing protein [Candidatus Natronoplasma sp.]